MAFKEGVTLGIALLGALLGLVNLWRQVSRDRVNLRILPQNYFTSAGLDGLCFDVVNLGFTPVTVVQVGVRLQGKKNFCVPGCDLPKRLEPRAAFTVYWPPVAAENPCLAGSRRAFVQTACGKTFHGKSPALRGRFEAAAKIAKEG